MISFDYSGSEAKEKGRGTMQVVITCMLVLFVQGMVLASAGWSADLVILMSAETGPYRQTVESFRRHMDPDVSVKEYQLEGRLDRAQDIGERIRGAHPRLVLAVGLKAALVAKSELPDTPVLFGMVVNPEEYGLPAPHMVGILTKVAPATQLEKIKSLMPNVRRIGLLYNEDTMGRFVSEARTKAKNMALHLVAHPVGRRDQVVKALRSILPQIDLLWMVQDPAIITEESVDFLLHSTLDYKIPVFTFSPALVQRGALGALVVRPSDVGIQAAKIAGAMLKHQGPSAPAIMEPELPQLALNLNTAEFLGLRPNPETVRTAAVLFGGPGDVAQHERTILQELIQ